MKVILAVVCITFIYVFSMVNLEAYRNQQLNKYDPNLQIEDHQIPNVDPETGDEVVEIEKISVTLTGAISKPGTYTMDKNSTFDDLIKLGGLTQESADESCYNLNLVLEDKMTYYIPKNTDFKVSINKADKQGLMMLKGIGEATADRIIRYKEENGDFQCIDDIKKVPGIKELTFNKIRDFIKL